MRMIKLLSLMVFVGFLASCASSSQLPDDVYGADGKSLYELDQERQRQGGQQQDGVEVLPFDSGSGGLADGLLDDEMMDFVPIIYFEYDQFTISEESQRTLEFYANQLLQNSSTRVVLEGHTDERGTPSYNLALGERRAQAVEEALVLYGVAQDRITTISFGEEAPVAFGHDEDSWSQNRRVELKF